MPLSGDGTIVARVTNVQNTNPWVKAGVMIRETLAAGSRQAFMLLSYSKGTAFQRRLVDRQHVGQHHRHDDHGRAVLAAARSRREHVHRVSVGGRHQLAAGRQRHDRDGARTSLFGLGVSSHTSDAMATATFDQVSVNGAAVTGSCAYAISPSSLSTGSRRRQPGGRGQRQRAVLLVDGDGVRQLARRLERRVRRRQRLGDGQRRAEHRRGADSAR